MKFLTNASRSKLTYWTQSILTLSPMFSILRQFFGNQYAAVNLIFLFTCFPIFIPTKLTIILPHWKRQRKSGQSLCWISNVVIILLLFCIRNICSAKKHFDVQQNDACDHRRSLSLSVEFLWVSLSRVSGQNGWHAHICVRFFIVSNYRKMSIDILKDERASHEWPMRISQHCVHLMWYACERHW